MEELADLAIHKYPACVKYRQLFKKIDQDVPEELIKQFGMNYRVLPLLEWQIFDYIHARHASMDTNKLLDCRWREFKKTWEKRIPGPFQFPQLKDYHFHKCINRYAPELSIDHRSNYAQSLKPGPGVDHLGELPIPGERLKMFRMNKTVNKNAIKPRSLQTVKPIQKRGKTVKKLC